MNIAIVPWSEDALDNNMFTKEPYGNQEWLENFNSVRLWFEKQGHRYETIDRYKNWDAIDYILVYYGSIHLKYVRSFLKKGYENKLIYMAEEPETVAKEHGKDRIYGLLKYYKYILTWNLKLADNRRIFLHNPFYVLKQTGKNIPFSQRKLLVAIYGHKTGYGRNELYSEREKIFRYFERYENQFDLYGRGWDGFQNYKGIAGDKSEIYCHYRFAIAFENMKDSKGYVSEKIFDCICNGVVPIYYGARNIRQYVPEDVFIDYRKFKSLDGLRLFLEQMPETVWEGYLEAAHNYITSEQAKLVAPDKFCKTLERLMITNPAKDIKCHQIDKILFYFRSFSIKESTFVMSIWKKAKKNRMIYHLWRKIKRMQSV